MASSGANRPSVQRGLELERHQGIDVDVRFKKAPLSPLGYTEARHYTLKAPFWSAAPSYRVGDEAARLMAEPSDAVAPRAVPDPGTVGVAVYDATCLFSKHGRYLLLRFAVHGVAVARWSRRLLEESAASLAGQLRGDALEDLGRWLKTEAELVRDGLVEGAAALIVTGHRSPRSFSSGSKSRCRGRLATCRNWSHEVRLGDLGKPI